MGGPLPLSGHCPSAHLLTHVLSASHPRPQTGAHVRFYLLRLPPCVRLLKHEHSNSTIGGGESNTAIGRYYPQGLFVCALCGCVLMGGPLALSAHFPSAHLFTHVLVCDASTAANWRARLL
jgi:hypothetical protein